ncbi:MAG: NYN domain-containing protein [Nitrospirae bacterium]|nr:NYN domain-containing protein [Nitrospirota bacterium]
MDDLSRNDDIIKGLAAPDRRRSEEVVGISSLIIDGYNLIGISHRDLRAEREGLVSRLAAYRQVKGHDITVVFDGWKSGGAREESLIVTGVKIIYTRLGDTADSVIRRIISREKKEWIVISSDREIISSAWTNGCVPVPSDEFRKIIGNADRSPGGGYDLIEEDEPHQRKGNPRMPSKKEKAMLRVLKKL